MQLTDIGEALTVCEARPGVAFGP